VLPALRQNIRMLKARQTALAEKKPEAGGSTATQSFRSAKAPAEYSSPGTGWDGRIGPSAAGRRRRTGQAGRIRPARRIGWIGSAGGSGRLGRGWKAGTGLGSAELNGIETDPAGGFGSAGSAGLDEIESAGGFGMAGRIGHWDA